MTAVLVAADVPAPPPDDGLPPGQPYVSPDDLASIPPLFAEAAQVALLPLVAEVWQRSAGTVHAQLVDAANLPGLPPVSSLAAETYLAQAANTFSQVGDDLWNTARSELLAGFQAGESIPQLADRLRGSAGLTARKATLVARTQVLDASNAGSYATAQTSGIDLRKGWLDTPDNRTRITHRAAGAQYGADQQMIPMGDQFLVGGYSCDRPHDPVLPPAERFSCRCALIYSMGTGAAEEAQKAAQPVTPLPNTSGQIEPAITPAAPSSTVAEIRQIEIENKVRSAYADILASKAEQSNRLVNLADLREALPDLNRLEQDAALRGLISQPGVLIIPETNQAALTPRLRAAAARIGGQNKHHISIADPSPRPLPRVGGPTVGGVAEGAVRSVLPVVESPLAARTVVQLRALAKQQGIVGYSKLTKPQLLERLTPPTPVSPPFEAARVLAGREALTSPTLDLSGVRAVPGVSTAQRAALNEYMSDAQRINAQIRAGQMSQRVDRTVRQLDSVIAESALRAETEVWRGLRSGADVFKGAPADLTGFEWSETAFVSTTANRQVAAEFAGSFGDPAPVIVRVKAPAGTHGITASEWGTGHAIGGQAEIVLERNLRFRVVADRGLVDEPGIPVKVRLVDVEVVPRSAPLPLEGRALREAARERNRIIEQRAAAEQTLAELDDLLVKKASREAFEERIAVAQLDPKDLAALRAAVGDPAKMRAAVTRITKKQGITVQAKSGAKVKFDPALHDPVGEVPAAGTPVVVIRRGTTLTVDGDTITLNKAVVKLPTAPVKRAPAKAVKAAPKKAAVPELPTPSDPRVAALPRTAGKPPTPVKAAKATNPKFGSTDQGPTYRDAGKAGRPYTPDMGPLPSGAFEENCTNVVHGFEMRMRGFDVQAAPLDVLDKYGYAAGRTFGEIDQLLTDAWRLPDGSAHGRSFAGQQWRSFTEIDGEIDSTWPDGGRGFIFVGKHIFNVVKVRGKAVYYEAQFDANTTRNVTALYKRKYRAYGGGEAKLFRVDDLEPVGGILDTITPI